MAVIHCHNCGAKVPVKTRKIRAIGIAIAAFGVFGWFSFLFAGSGHAFLISCAIFFGGLFVAWQAEELGKTWMKNKECQQCGCAQLREEERAPKRYARQTGIVVNKTSPSAPVQQEALRKCPRCQIGYLQRRNGRYGPFMGCSRYPDCRYTEDAK